MAIDITGIPSNILKPGFYARYNTAGAAGLGAFSQKLLIVAQRLASGLTPALVATQVFSEAYAASLFGAGSVAHRMVLAAMAQDSNLAPWVVALDDAPASAAATGTITITGAATGSGSMVTYIAYTRVEVGILQGDTPTIVAARLAAAINAVASLPVTASAAAGVVTLTAKNKGTNGNGIAINCAVSAAGIAAAIVAMSGGATDPDIQPALDLVFPGQFHVIAAWDASALALGKIKTYLDAVSGPIEERPGRAFVGVTGAKNIATQVTLATGVNHERVSVSYLPGSWTLPYEIAAATAGQVASETDPARPYNGVVLVGVHAPDLSQRLGRTEQEALLAAGVTPLEVNSIGQVEIVRLLTTRTTTAGVSDQGLLDTMSIAIMDYVRQEDIAMVKKKFPRAKNTAAVRESMNRNSYSLALKLEELEILQDVEKHKALFQVEPDPNVPGRVRKRFPAAIVPGLHQIFETIDLIQ